MGNARLIRDQQYQTDPDAGMTQMTTGKNADASQPAQKKLSYVAPCWAMLYPSKLRALCSYAAP